MLEEENKETGTFCGAIEASRTQNAVCVVGALIFMLLSIHYAGVSGANMVVAYLVSLTLFTIIAGAAILRDNHEMKKRGTSVFHGAVLMLICIGMLAAHIYLILHAEKLFRAGAMTAEECAQCWMILLFTMPAIVLLWGFFGIEGCGKDNVVGEAASCGELKGNASCAQSELQHGVKYAIHEEGLTACDGAKGDDCDAVEEAGVGNVFVSQVSMLLDTSGQVAVVL